MTIDYKNFRPELAAALGGTLADNLISTLNTLQVNAIDLTDGTADLNVDSIIITPSTGFLSGSAEDHSKLRWTAADVTMLVPSSAMTAPSLVGFPTIGFILGAASNDKLGFFGIGPVSRPSAYTQTYSTADKTHANPTAATLTMADGAGTNDNTIGAITADASVVAAFQEVVDEINKAVADIADAKQLINSVIDDLQALGLVQ